MPLHWNNIIQPCSPSFSLSSSLKTQLLKCLSCFIFPLFPAIMSSWPHSEENSVTSEQKVLQHLFPPSFFFCTQAHTQFGCLAGRKWSRKRMKGKKMVSAPTGDRKSQYSNCSVFSVFVRESGLRSKPQRSTVVAIKRSLKVIVIQVV